MYKVCLVDGLPDISLKDISLESGLLSDIAEVKAEVVEKEEMLSLEVFDADVIISWHLLNLSARIIGKLKNCKGIVRTGVGFDNVDVIAAGKKGIPVYNIPDYGISEVADHTLALILALTRKLKIYDEEAANGGWDWQAASPLRRLSSLTLGVVGCGRIGSEVVKRAKVFGFHVFFYDPYLPKGFEDSLGVGRSNSLKELLGDSDIVTLHVPLTEETKHIISQREMKIMKVGSILVNTARGPVVDNKALVEALVKNRLGGAGLDVIEGEPEVPQELKNNPKVMITPHSAFYSEESIRDLRRKSAELARKILLKEPLPEPVNKKYIV